MGTWQEHLTQARRFWELAQAADERAYGNPAASNAALAVINANDAVCLRLGGKKSEGRSPIEAADVLTEVCRGSRWERDAAEQVSRLRDVIGGKNAAEYRGRELTASQVARIMKQAHRFLDWAEAVLRE
jgi:pyruvate kinase